MRWPAIRPARWACPIIWAGIGRARPESRCLRARLPGPPGQHGGDLDVPAVCSGSTCDQTSSVSPRILATKLPTWSFGVPVRRGACWLTEALSWPATIWAPLIRTAGFMPSAQLNRPRTTMVPIPRPPVRPRIRCRRLRRGDLRRSLILVGRPPAWRSPVPAKFKLVAIFALGGRSGVTGATVLNHDTVRPVWSAPPHQLGRNAPSTRHAR